VLGGRSGLGEQQYASGHGRGAHHDRGEIGRGRGAHVGPQHDVRIQQLDQRVEVPGSGGGQERVDDRPLAPRLRFSASPTASAESASFSGSVSFA
jgi:hypothetical protein